MRLSPGGQRGRARRGQGRTAPDDRGQRRRRERSCRHQGERDSKLMMAQAVAEDARQPWADAVAGQGHGPDEESVGDKALLSGDHWLEPDQRGGRGKAPAGAETRQRQHRDDERSEEHTSELQSLMRISYAVFCLKKKNKPNNTNT